MRLRVLEYLHASARSRIRNKEETKKLPLFDLPSPPLCSDHRSIFLLDFLLDGTSRTRYICVCFTSHERFDIHSCVYTYIYTYKQETIFITKKFDSYIIFLNKDISLIFRDIFADVFRFVREENRFGIFFFSIKVGSLYNRGVLWYLKRWLNRDRLFSSTLPLFEALIENSRFFRRNWWNKKAFCRISKLGMERWKRFVLF